MGILWRTFVKFLGLSPLLPYKIICLVLLATVFFGFLLVFDEENTIQVNFLANLFDNTACTRRNGTDRYSEGYHYPNQTLYYSLIVTGEAEE